MQTGRLERITEMYSCEHGMPIRLVGQVGKNVHTRKNGTTYQLFRTLHSAYPTDKLKTWEELSDKQRILLKSDLKESEQMDRLKDIAMGTGAW